jgi:hypothetical protein
VKIATAIIGWLAIAVVVLPTHAQGTFQNLDFEQAGLYLTPVPSGQFGGEVPVSSALPDWTAYLGNVQQTQALQNNYTAGTASINILGPDWGSGLGQSPSMIIDGSYTVMLQAGTEPGNMNVYVSASIAQNGTVPLTAQSVEFKAWALTGPTAPSIYFNGNSLPPVVISSTPNFTLYGANISPYAGQSGQLEFTAGTGSGPDWILLDDISFSTGAVPEPNPLTLTGIGGLLFALYRRVAQKRE